MDIIDSLSIITAVSLFFLALFLFTYKKGNVKSNRILAFFLLINASFVFHFFLFHIKIITRTKYPFIWIVGYTLYFFLGPLILFYTKSLCYRDYKFNKKDILHTIPFFLLSGSMLVYIKTRSAALIRSGDINANSISVSALIVYYIFLYLFLFIYIFVTIRVLMDYRKKLKNYFSNVRSINLSWMLSILMAFVLMLIVDVWIFIFIYFINASPIYTEVLTIITLFINFSLVLILVFMGMKQSIFYSGLLEGQKYGQSRLTKTEADQYAKKLNDYIKNEKPYIDPLLSLNGLAKSLSISTRILSQVINNSLKQNFFNLIGSYRIEEAKEMLSKYNYQEKSILEILYDVGFNSKSSFNNIFKKKTGMTPSEYRKKHSQS